MGHPIVCWYLSPNQLGRIFDNLFYWVRFIFWLPTWKNFLRSLHLFVHCVLVQTLLGLWAMYLLIIWIAQKKFSPKFHQNFKKLKKWIWLLVELVSTFRRSGGINNHKVQKVIQTVDSMNKKYDHCNDLHPCYNLFRDMRVIMMYGLFFTSLTFFFFETKWFQNNPV